MRGLPEDIGEYIKSKYEEMVAYVKMKCSEGLDNDYLLNGFVDHMLSKNSKGLVRFKVYNPERHDIDFDVFWFSSLKFFVMNSCWKESRRNRSVLSISAYCNEFDTNEHDLFDDVIPPPASKDPYSKFYRKDIIGIVKEDSSIFPIFSLTFLKGLGARECMKELGISKYVYYKGIDRIKAKCEGVLA